MGKTNRKAKKARNAIGILMPMAGAPYEIEVQIDENDTVEYEGMCWAIAPNSVWNDGKYRRVILPEALAESLNGANSQALNQTQADENKKLIERKYGISLVGSMVVGKTYLNARTFFLFMKMALLEQLFRLQSKKPWFKESSTWIIAGCLAIVALILVWMTVGIGNGFDHIQNALNHVQVPSTTPNPVAGGHNNIAPQP